MGRKGQERAKICGIYKIVYRGGIYIGNSVNIYQRFSAHKSNLRSGTHSAKELQKEYSKYGGKVKFQIIIECPEWALYWVEYKILRNCEKRGVKLWNSHGRNSLNGNPPEIEYIYNLFD